jgi:hypothetical protein
VTNGDLRFRCHVGHAYTARTLAAADARGRGSDRSARLHDEAAHANESHATMLRNLITVAPAPVEDEAAGD